MNFISCTIRLVEIPNLELWQNKIPFTEFNVEVSQARKTKVRRIVKAVVWGDLAYDIKNYYYIDDYLIIEGYFSILLDHERSINKFIKLHIFRIYPYLN